MTYLKGTTLDLLHSNVRQRHALVEHEHRIDHHLAEETLLVRNQLAAHRRRRTLDQHLPLLLRRLVANLDGDFVDVRQCNGSGVSVGAQNHLRVHTILNERLGLTQQFTRNQNHCGSAVTNFGVL